MTYRLGDDVDDFCIKCKRLTNHAIVSMMNEEPAKVRCRTCYNDHDWRRCEIPPSKKDLKKMQLLSEALAAGGAVVADGDAEVVETIEGVEGEIPLLEGEAEPEVPAVEVEDGKQKKGKKARGAK